MKSPAIKGQIKTHWKYPGDLSDYKSASWRPYGLGAGMYKGLKGTNPTEGTAEQDVSGRLKVEGEWN